MQQAKIKNKNYPLKHIIIRSPLINYIVNKMQQANDMIQNQNKGFDLPNKS